MDIFEMDLIDWFGEVLPSAPDSPVSRLVPFSPESPASLLVPSSPESLASPLVPPCSCPPVFPPSLPLPPPLKPASSSASSPLVRVSSSAHPHPQPEPAVHSDSSVGRHPGWPLDFHLAPPALGSSLHLLPLDMSPALLETCDSVPRSSLTHRQYFHPPSLICYLDLSEPTISQSQGESSLGRVFLDLQINPLLLWFHSLKCHSLLFGPLG